MRPLQSPRELGTSHTPGMVWRWGHEDLFMGCMVCVRVWRVKVMKYLGEGYVHKSVCIIADLGRERQALDLDLWALLSLSPSAFIFSLYCSVSLLLYVEPVYQPVNIWWKGFNVESCVSGQLASSTLWDLYAFLWLLVFTRTISTLLHAICNEHKHLLCFTEFYLYFLFRIFLSTCFIPYF